MQQLEQIEVLPRVTRVVEGLRDTGYDFNSAIADIVDNSIAARATRIDIEVQADYLGQILVSIADNGIGMDKDGLVDAFRYGSERREDPASLGKFGLGLKTASTAFSRRLVVSSRSVNGGSVITGIFDLDDIGESNKWEIGLRSGTSEDISDLNKVSGENTGTIVKWEKVDRLLNNFKNPAHKFFKNALNRLVEGLEFHLGMVFQRFIDPNFEGVQDVSINLNNSPVTAWDPFVISETKRPEYSETIEVELPNGDQTKFSISGYVLPRSEEFETTESGKNARISTNTQGVYVYRENRLIHGPDWLGMYTSDPHMSLLRVDLSFGHKLDPAFNVDIKKSRINLSEELYDYIRDKFLPPLRREANQRYRNGQVKTKSKKPSIHATSDKVIHSKHDGLYTAAIGSVDEITGEVAVTNRVGAAKGKISIIQNDSVEFGHIETAPTLDDGVLWEAAIVNQSHGVLINEGHPFYQKVYLAHVDSPTFIQSLDYMIWSLAQAELNNTRDIDRETLADFRIDVSRNLKKLVQGLPDAPVEDVD